MASPLGVMLIDSRRKMDQNDEFTETTMADVTFLHCSDIHLGKTYSDSPGAAERYEDFFGALSSIVDRAVKERVDAVLIAGDLFHQAQVMPRTFARTVETLAPLQRAGIPAIAIEGNHDWIHRRESLSWMEALSDMGYLCLLRPERDEKGNYRFPDWDERRRRGGHMEINGVHIYGVGYIGAYAGSHVPRILEAIETNENVLLFHVGVRRYCGTDIGNMTIDEALPLGEKFSYVALGHGHKPYEIPKDEPFAFNPGSPECVNFGEQKYEPKGFYRVEWRFRSRPQVMLVPTSPRPMFDERVALDGCENLDQAEDRIREHFQSLKDERSREDRRKPVVRVKLAGEVTFRPAEMTRQRVAHLVAEIMDALHVEVQNALSFVTGGRPRDGEHWNLAEIERQVVQALWEAQSAYKQRAERYAQLAMKIKERLLEGSTGAGELLDVIHRTLHEE